jgi:Ca2+-binding RTX toxin-like protein
LAIPFSPTIIEEARALHAVVVEDWYACDGNKVFLATNGRTSFEVTLGNQEADVTRIAELPMRAELLQANGDGSDLPFSFRGNGDVVIDLKSGGGAVATGADTGTMNGGLLTLNFNSPGTQTENVDHQGGAVGAGTAGADFVFGSEQGMRIDGGQGSDQLFGGGGSDEFVFGPGVGSDTVLDFDLGADKVVLVGTGFADTTQARTAFSQGADGAELALSATERLVLAHIDLNTFTETHLILEGDNVV